jgi:methionyl aminopeptidase
VGLFGRKVQVKSPEQVAAMRVAGLLVGETLELLRSSVAPGVTTADLDAIAEEHIRSAGGVPSFLGYGRPPFPATICTSVNDAVVHGIPGGEVLRDGDVVSIDWGAVVDGWPGDAAITVGVGEPAADVVELMRVTEEALWQGIAAAREGGRVSDISHAVEQFVRAQPHPTGGDYGILEDFTGHGIGTEMHQPPDVPNYGPPGRGPELVPGLALAVEPMITLGTAEVVVDADEWTIRSADQTPAAHFEHTFVLTGTGTWVLAALDGGRARLAELGVPYGGS